MPEILFLLCIHFGAAPADNALRYEFAVKDSSPPKELFFVDTPKIPYCAKHLYEPITVQVWGLGVDADGNVKYGPPSGIATFQWQKFPDANGDGVIGFTDFLALMRATLNTTAEELALFDLDGDGDVGASDFSRFRLAFQTCISADKVREVPCP